MYMNINAHIYISVYAHACKRETCVFVCVGLWPTFILKSLCVCPATTQGGVGRRAGGWGREELARTTNTGSWVEVWMRRWTYMVGCVMEVVGGE